MLCIVKGMFRMVVDAGSAPEAKNTAERELKAEGVKAIALCGVQLAENDDEGEGGGP